MFNKLFLFSITVYLLSILYLGSSDDIEDILIAYQGNVFFTAQRGVYNFALTPTSSPRQPQPMNSQLLGP